MLEVQYTLPGCAVNSTPENVIHRPRVEKRKIHGDIDQVLDMLKQTRGMTAKQFLEAMALNVPKEANL